MASLPEEPHAPPQAEPERALADRALLLFDAIVDAHGLPPDLRPGLRHQFERLLAREAAVRSGEDAEDVHQLRVATRRLRASLQVVASCFEPQLIRHFRRGLRAVATALGAVRDRDVFREHLAHYQESLPAPARDGLDRLLAAVEQDYNGAWRHERYAERAADADSDCAANLAALGERSHPHMCAPRVDECAARATSGRVV